MDFNINGECELNQTEQETVINGLKLLVLYCDSKIGCAGCPFFLGFKARNEGGDYCELKRMPCLWDIPDTMQGGKNNDY